MATIAYKYFSNSLDFENWQKEYKKTARLDILHIQPVTSNGIIENEIHWEEQAKPIASSTVNYNLIIFVTYNKEA